MEMSIHRVWLGPDPMPDAYREYGDRWAAMNPDWVLTDWTESALRLSWGDQMPCPEIWDRLATEAKAPVPMRHEVAVATQRADILGYFLVYRYGGIYLNCDLEPLKPLSELPVSDFNRYAWAGREDDVFLNNGAIGGPRGHAFWKAVLDRLPVRYNRLFKQGAPMNQTTGPHLLTNVFDSWRLSPEFPNAPVEALPKHIFHFASYMQVPPGGDASAYRDEAIKAGAVALHHWGHRGQLKA